MSQDVEQLVLLADGRPLRAEQPIPDQAIFRQQDELAALKLSCQASGLDEKQIFGPLQIDKATWSKIFSGQAYFPTTKYGKFMDVVGNEIYLTWLAHSRGKGLHDLEDSKDKELRQLREKLIEAQKEIDILVKYGVIGKQK